MTKSKTWWIWIFLAGIVVVAVLLTSLYFANN